MTPARFYRLSETKRPLLRFWLNAHPCTALEGDSVLTAILTNSNHLRRAEFGPEQRAGFCLMGACQDCWVWQEQGPRLRACSTEVRAEMRLLTRVPQNWPVLTRDEGQSDD